MSYQPADRRLPPIVVDHPIQMIDQDGLRQRATQIADAVEHLLKDEEP